MSYVRCVERSGGQCVQLYDKTAAWDAFAILGWLGHGSPVAILQVLPRELDHHRTPKSVQARMVDLNQSLRERLRGAECEPKQVVALADIVPKLREYVEQRLRKLGVWGEDMNRVVDILTEEAREGLTGGFIVHMGCYGDPYEIFVATASQEERQVVVGMMTALPLFLGGTTPSREIVEGRLANPSFDGAGATLGVIREGTVDSAWLPFPVEEF